MTNRLKLAVEQAATGLPEESQNILADAIIAAAQDEQALILLLMSLNEAKWNITFARSQDKLERMADRALRAYEAGETEPLDPDKL
jgi:hypothetical protein